MSSVAARNRKLWQGPISSTLPLSPSKRKRRPSLDEVFATNPLVTAPPPVALDAPPEPEAAAALEPSPFSPTKKFRGLTLATRASPRFGGSSQTRNLMLLYRVFLEQHKRNERLTFLATLRKEYPTKTDADLSEMVAHVECTIALEATRANVAEQRWSPEEKRRLGIFFDLFDVDASGTMCLHELLEFGQLAGLSRLSLKVCVTAQM